MQFLVTRLRVRGVRLPDEEWIHAPAVSGDVITHWVQDELSGDWIVQATIHDRARARDALLPELNRVQLGLISPLALVLRGYERQRGKAGLVDFFQEWLLRPVIIEGEPPAVPACQPSGVFAGFGDGRR